MLDRAGLAPPQKIELHPVLRLPPEQLQAIREAIRETADEPWAKGRYLDVSGVNDAPKELG